MKKLNRVWLITVLGMLVIILMAQPAVFADSGKLYGEAGAGLVIFNPPEKDSFPFYETDTIGVVGNAGRVESPLKFNPDDTAVSGNLLFGYRLGGSEPTGLFGANLRVEFSTNFYFPDYNRTKRLDDVKNDTTGLGGLVTGAFFSNDGMEGVAFVGVGVIGIETVSDVRFKADYDYIDFTLNLRCDHALVKDLVTLSPYVGLTLALLEQDFSYSAEQPDGIFIIGGPYDYNVKEELDSWYAGLVIGADVIFNVTPEFSFSLGGSFSPLYADTDMDLKFDGRAARSIVDFGDETTRVSDSGSNWTFRAMAKAEASYRINWFAVSLSGMVDYWDDVPVVDYPDYSSGDWGATLPAGNFSDKVPEIDGKHMLNYGAMFNVTFYFM